jgi:hypothetical protein
VGKNITEIPWTRTAKRDLGKRRQALKIEKNSQKA